MDLFAGLLGLAALMGLLLLLQWTTLKMCAAFFCGGPLDDDDDDDDGPQAWIDRRTAHQVPEQN